MRPLLPLAALLLGLAGPAAAQTPDLTALGRQEFAAGQKEFNLGHYESALAHWEAAYRLTAKAELLYDLAYVGHELFQRSRRIDQLQQAIQRYHAFLDSTHDGEPRTTQLRAKSMKEVAAAEEELAREQAARTLGEEALSLGEELLRKGKPADAAAQLDRYRRGTDNERPGLARAFALQAGIATAKNDATAATDAWARALSLDRSLAPPAAAPEEERRAFAEAERALGDARPLSITHTPAGSYPPAAPVELAFAVASDPKHLAVALRLHYRASAGGAFSTLRVTTLDKIALPRPFSAALPPGAKVQYYAEVLDASDGILEHLGSAAAPFSVAVEALPPPPPRRAWLWAAGAALVAVAAAGIGLGVYLSQGPSYTNIPTNFGLLHW